MVFRHDRNAESRVANERSSIRLFHAPGGTSSWDLIGHTDPAPAPAPAPQARAVNNVVLPEAETTDSTNPAVTDDNVDMNMNMNMDMNNNNNNETNDTENVPSARALPSGKQAAPRSTNNVILADDHLTQTPKFSSAGRDMNANRAQDAMAAAHRAQCEPAVSSAPPVTGARAASRVLQPPGGRSSFTLG